MPVRTFKFLNYLTDLREADHDYSATVDHPKPYVDCSAFSNKNMADAHTLQTAVTLDIRSLNDVSSPSVELCSFFLNVVFS